MRIGIEISRNSYTPEAYAYEKYLLEHGHEVELDYSIDLNNDVNIYFMGLNPFWKKKYGSAKIIHEYHSLSTPPFPRIKDFIKTKINTKPDSRIFLNDKVRTHIPFSDNIPFIYRDMGVDKELFQKPLEKPKYDIIYCGSINGREGLIEIIRKISKRYKIVVVGAIDNENKRKLTSNNITLLGKINRFELPEVYRNARFGLNYTPDMYPFNIQTSTKTLEYLASGLGLISNRYRWINNFSKALNFEPLWIENLKFLDSYNVQSLNIDNYSWDNILEGSNLNSFIMSVYEK